MPFSVISEDALPYVELRWHLVDLQLDSIVLSNFIEFEGIKAVRLAIQNLKDEPCKLSLFSNQFCDTGIEITSVFCRVDDSVWMSMASHGSQSIILFDAVYNTPFLGSHWLIFRVMITNPEENYRFLLRDNNLSHQLMSATNQSDGKTDLEIQIQDKSFSVHKSLLASRSPVLADMISNLSLGNKKMSILEKDLEPTTFKGLLKHLYTDEFELPTTQPELFRKIAATLELSTLTKLREIPLRESLVSSDLIEILRSLEVTAKKQPVTVSVHAEDHAFKSHCGFMTCINDVLSSESVEAFQYQDETVFGWQHTVTQNSDRTSTVHICFFSSISYESDLYVYDVICRRRGSLITMVERHRDEDSIVQFFDAQIIRKEFDHDDSICFDIFIRSSVKTVAVKLIDVQGSQIFWKAARNGKFTDVEFQVGSKTFFAHQWLVAARSPVLASMFSDLLLEEAANCDVDSSLETLSDKSIIKPTILKIDDTDPDIFLAILEYLYLGVLSVEPSKTLLVAAEKYEIDTLISLCKTTLREVDCERLSFKLLSY